MVLGRECCVLHSLLCILCYEVGLISHTNAILRGGLGLDENLRCCGFEFTPNPKLNPPTCYPYLINLSTRPGWLGFRGEPRMLRVWVYPKPKTKPPTCYPYLINLSTRMGSIGFRGEPRMFRVWVYPKPVLNLPRYHP